MLTANTTAACFLKELAGKPPGPVKWSLALFMSEVAATAIENGASILESTLVEQGAQSSASEHSMSPKRHNEDAPSRRSEEKLPSKEASGRPTTLANSRQHLRIDRQKTCPMLLRMFCRMNGYHRMGDFSRATLPVDDELTVYTWKDATFKELSSLIKEVNEDACRRDARFAFRLVYQENIRGEFRSRELGLVYNGKATVDDRKTLEEMRFVPGDFLDVAIYFGPPTIAPLEREERPLSSSAGRGGRPEGGHRRDYSDRDDGPRRRY